METLPCTKKDPKASYSAEEAGVAEFHFSKFSETEQLKKDKEHKIMH